MRVINSIHSLQKIIKNLRTRKKRIGFVPTMGALHEGHRSLIRKCRRENDIIVLSIFVNPKQFDKKKDLQLYPRPVKKDKIFAKNEKIDIIFYPSIHEMYPTGYLTNVNIVNLTRNLEGKQRPGHFQGVTTVITKLLNIVTPDVIYLGQKDAQQTLVIKRLVKDLNYKMSVRICPTVRNKDGLALSSRNRLLSSKECLKASILFQSLKEAKQKILSGERSVQKILAFMRSTIRKNSSGKIEYIACVDAKKLTAKKILDGKIMIALAVQFNKARLIDNIIFQVK